MNRGSGRSYWNRRGGGGRSWNGRSSHDSQSTTQDGVSMNRNAARSSNRRNYTNSNFRSSNRRYGPPMDNFDRIEEIGTRTSNSISIAIEGCCHGQLTAIYDRLRKYEEDDDDADNVEVTLSSEHGGTENATAEVTAEQTKTKTKKIDLLICCGDFQSIRTPADFHSLAVPAKYREMGTFHKYYNEEWVAPVLTIFCGGNHEASQPLSELYYGGWVAPKMYYLGAAGVVRFRGIRIGGLSGIYKSHDHYQSRNEIPPYDQKQVRSVYHYRNLDVYRLSCLKTDASAPPQFDHGHSTTNDQKSHHINNEQPPRRLDIMVSHDWPQGIEQYGDVNDLVRRKPFFRQEINENALGSPPAAHLLHKLQPLYWFAAHLHVKFHAKVVHRGVITADDNSKKSGTSASETKGLIPSQVFHATIRSSADATKESTFLPPNQPKDPPSMTTDERSDDDNDATSAAAMSSTTHFLAPESASCPKPLPDLTELMTQFLSLDKCLPRRQYLSILHLPIASSHDSDNNVNDDPKLEYDLEWLAILRKTHHLAASTHPHRVQLPQMIQQSHGDTTCPHQVADSDIAWVKERIGADLTIPENFTPTLSEKYDEHRNQVQPPPLPRMGNPLTDSFLDLLQLEHLPNLTIPYSTEQGRQTSISTAFSQNPNTNEPTRLHGQVFADEDEIDLDEEIQSTFNTAVVSSGVVNKDEDEIDVDDAVSADDIQLDEALRQNDTKKPRIDDGQ